MDELNNGLIDFAVIFTDVDHTLYHSIELPAEDSFGLSRLTYTVMFPSG